MIKGIDLYGEKINLTYEGSETYKTYPGAFVSFIVLLVMVAYSIYRGVILINKMNPDVSKKSFLRDLNLAGDIKPYESGYNIAFGIT